MVTAVPLVFQKASRACLGYNTFCDHISGNASI